jgi:NifU-like protein
MAKSDLIGGAMWDEYSKKVSRLMDNPENRGEFSEEEAKQRNAKLIVADFGAESCGDAVRLYWLVDEKTDKIIDAKFKSFGCGTAIASSDTMVELCIGKTVDEALKITNIDVEFAMRDTPDVPAVPPQKMHCSVMAYDVIKKAASIYKGVDMSEIEDGNIICECAQISLQTIKEVIKLNNLTTVEQITDFTKAGAFCKSCIKPGGHEAKEYYLVDILADTLKEIEAEKLGQNSSFDPNGGFDPNNHFGGSNETQQVSFKEMTIVQKLKAIESSIDEKIRPMLVMDGGNLEILDIKESGEDYHVYIRYLGACDGCASSSTGTLFAIESVLQETVDKSIRVLPI